jgi:hypothetical protein
VNAVALMYCVFDVYCVYDGSVTFCRGSLVDEVEKKKRERYSRREVNVVELEVYAAG